jgi:hypothetical protein
LYAVDLVSRNDLSKLLSGNSESARRQRVTTTALPVNLLNRQIRMLKHTIQAMLTEDGVTVSSDERYRSDS